MIVAQVITDLHRAWDGPPTLLELTGPAGGRWTVGHGAPTATIRADTADFLRARSGGTGRFDGAAGTLGVSFTKNFKILTIKLK